MSSALESIPPVTRKETLGAIVRQELRSALMAGHFQPGEKLTIRAVANALAVSITPAREAFYNLVAEGILQSGANGTIYVPKLQEAHIRELSLIRIRLEELASREALPNLGSKGIDKLSNLHDRLLELDAAKTTTKVIKLNWRFYFGIYEAVEMPMLQRIIETCWLKMGSYLNVIYPDYGKTGMDKDSRARILDALKTNDPDTSETPFVWISNRRAIS
ncbi:GntR family transcriptional regulator [Rhodobacterales bacterium]|nr:GntR family transcriptional regulator [Rhodobacterales bacterium]